MYLKRIPSWFRPYSKQLIWDNKPSEKIFISFDDGPHPNSSPLILSKLKQLGIKAQFFCLGIQVQKYPELYQQILDDGHMTGNHGYRHISGWKNSFSDYINNIKEAESYITSLYFRPPYGKITPRQIKAVSKTYKIIMWNRMPGDFDSSKNKDHMKTSNLLPFNKGDIIVLHDRPDCIHNTLSFLDNLNSSVYSFGLMNEILETDNK